jgi:hypothetical protein
VDVGSIGRTTYKLLSCDCVRVASQDPEEELAASNFLTIGIRAQVSCSDRRARFCAGYGTVHVHGTIHVYVTIHVYGTIHVYDTIHKYGTSTVREYRSSGSKSVKSIQQEGCLAKPILKLLLKTLRSGVQTMDLAGP